MPFVFRRNSAENAKPTIRLVQIRDYHTPLQEQTYIDMDTHVRLSGPFYHSIIYSVST